MSSVYAYVLEERAVDFLVALEGEEQDLLRGYFRWLAVRPNATGMVEHRDSAGRWVQGPLCGSFVIATWTDHAVKEVRVVEVLHG